MEIKFRLEQEDLPSQNVGKCVHHKEVYHTRLFTQVWSPMYSWKLWNFSISSAQCIVNGRKVTLLFFMSNEFRNVSLINRRIYF